MVVGLFENFLGRRLFRPTLFIIGLFSTVAIILFLFYVLFLPTGTNDWVGWTVLAVAVVLGLVLGFFLAKLSRVGLFLLGAWGGAIIGLVLSETVLYKADSIAALWVPVVVLGLLVGVLSFKWYNHIVIIATCVLGSYLFIRGLAIFAGGYPNEFTVYSEIRDGTISAVRYLFIQSVGSRHLLRLLGRHGCALRTRHDRAVPHQEAPGRRRKEPRHLRARLTPFFFTFIQFPIRAYPVFKI